MKNNIYLLFKNIIYAVGENNAYKPYKWTNNIDELIAELFKTKKKTITLLLSSDISFNITVYNEKGNKVTDDFIRSKIVTQIPVDRNKIEYKYQILNSQNDYEILQIEVFPDRILRGNDGKEKVPDLTYKQIAMQNMHCLSNVISAGLPRDSVNKILIYEIGDIYEINLSKDNAIQYSETIGKNSENTKYVLQKLVFIAEKYFKTEKFDLYINTRALESIFKSVELNLNMNLRPYAKSITNLYPLYLKSIKYEKIQAQKEEKMDFNENENNTGKKKELFGLSKRLIFLLGALFILIIILVLFLIFADF